MSPRHVVAGFGIVLVVVAIGVGVVVIGSPAEGRARRLDERRISALQILNSAINDYWRTHSRLPRSIAELSQEPRVVSEIKDPVTGQEYAYRTLTDRTYQLCAA